MLPPVLIPLLHAADDDGMGSDQLADFQDVGIVGMSELNHLFF